MSVFPSCLGSHRENLRINTVNRAVARIARPSAEGARPSREIALCMCFDIAREVVRRESTPRSWVADNGRKRIFGEAERRRREAEP